MPQIESPPRRFERRRISIASGKGNGERLVLDIDVPAGMTEEQVVERLKPLASRFDDLHQALGGSGLNLHGVGFFPKTPSRKPPEEGHDNGLDWDTVIPLPPPQRRETWHLNLIEREPRAPEIIDDAEQPEPATRE